MPYIQLLSEAREAPENFLNLPSTKNPISIEIPKNLRHIVLVGVGGASSGTKAVYGALAEFSTAEIIFLETVDQKQLEGIANFLNNQEDPEAFAIVVASSSGKTLEITTNLEFLLKSVPTAENRLFVITRENSPLHQNAQKMNSPTIITPDWLSDRFSVFSPVSLFPLACAGIDIKNLLEGASSKTDEFFQNPENSPEMLFAQRIHKEMQDGKNIHNLFIFDFRLEFVGKWYEQLLAESLGKDGKGLTPTTSIGTMDLHSKTQLDLGGPKDKIFTFLRVAGGDGTFPNAVQSALYEAAKKSYENHVAVSEITMPEISEFELGRFMQSRMIEVALLGNLLGVDTFIQPDVEEYKKLALELL